MVMAPSLSLRGLLMVVICSLAVLSLVQTLDTLYVKPTPDTPCDKDPCLTLMDYVDNSSQYFTRDTEAVFLSGQHLLERNIEVGDVTTFIMRKEINASQSHPEIVCTATAGLAFSNVSFVSITELSFASCGTSTTPTNWVFLSFFVGLFIMDNTTVKMAHASAVLSIYSTFYSIENHFQDNANTGIRAVNSKLSIENSQFYNNSASSLGGAMYLSDSVTVFRGVNIFADNKASAGGGIFSVGSDVSFEGSNIFMKNSATLDGGAIRSFMSIINFNGNTIFMDNSANAIIISAVGALSSTGDIVTFTGNTSFIGNGPSASILTFAICAAVIEGIFTFENNQGGIIAQASNVTIEGTTSFINNSGILGLGTLDVFSGSRLTFYGTTLFAGNSHVDGNGNGAVIVLLSTIQFNGHTTFTGNTGSIGAVLLALQASIEFNGSQSFEYNIASIRGGTILMFDSVVNITGCSSFINNSAGTQGGAISNANGQLYITGNITFIGNQAPLGGGLYFEYISQMFLISPLELSFQHNSAEKGGAIYVSDETNNIFCSNDPILTISGAGGCFIHVESLSSDIQLKFDGNAASEGGENIFGGMLDRCIVNDDILSPEQGLSLLINETGISSEPLRLCFCINGNKNCTYAPPPFSTARGETISVSAVAVDQVNNTVAATIRSYIPYNKETVSDFSLGQGIQQIGATCTPLNYTIQTRASNVTFILYAEGPCRDIGNSQRQISVYLLPCPVAFELSDTECICEVRLQSFTNSCSAESQTFSRNTNFWVGTEYRDNNYTGLILHSHCPLDYCISNPADISVNDLDSQCSFNRSGILCGSCQQNLSLALGSSQCLQCSNSYLALLFPFAIAGFALVFILFILQLTVSKGTLNGLIFYANIVAVNKEIFFPPRSINVLTVFIAWLNLDLGIETCFFNGMDTYARTWLQYAFPFYIWLLVCIIIVTSHYSARASKLLGKNPIAVLATLFLLSYAKLLRTIIASFSAVVLDYPGNSTDTVWLSDGNIRYLRGKHIPLFLFSLAILLVLFLPYTMLLFLSQWLQTLSFDWMNKPRIKTFLEAHNAQWLQALSEKKPFFWMDRRRMRTFLDAYHAPYDSKHRYWTGLLLLLRCVLFLVFAFNVSGDPSVNLLAISSVALGLAMSTRVIGQVYSKWWLDILEGSFILNLGITAAATFYVMQSGGDQSAVAYISVSVALIEFVGILTYHTYLQLKDTNMWIRACYAWNKVRTFLLRQKSPDNVITIVENPQAHLATRVTEVSLAELQKSAKGDEETEVPLREPVLDF